MFKKVFLMLFAASCLSACASAPQRSPSGEKIETGVNTIVIASSKTAKQFLRELKYRALERDFTFDKTDEDTHSFVTEMKNISKKVSVQIKAFVKDVAGGSNAVVDGRFLKRKDKNKEVQKISNRSSPSKKASWKMLFDYATADKAAKYNFIER